MQAEKARIKRSGQMAKKMLRPQQIYGRDRRIPVSKSNFWDNIVYREGGDPFIPGTNETVPRLRLAHLGVRSVAAFEDEVDAIVEGLRKHRDAPAARPHELAAAAEGGEQAQTPSRSAPATKQKKIA
jgi:hypothetical protein